MRVILDERAVSPEAVGAATRLEEYLSSLPLVPVEAEVMVPLGDDALPHTGDGGYVIRTLSPTTIEIGATTVRGATNGIRGFMDEVRKLGHPNPFTLRWFTLVVSER